MSPCIDKTASSDYVYRLSPGEPERYAPTGSNRNYQSANPAWWPTFGALNTGSSNGPPGSRVSCSQEVCGGDSNWGHTDLEVWRLPPPPPPPPTFFGSRILTPTQQVTLSSWAPQGPTQQWTLCYSSFTDDASTPSIFHSQCDEYDVTMVVARNSLGYTFGGYVRSPLRRFCLVSAVLVSAFFFSS